MRYSLSILALVGAVAAQTPGFDAITNPSAAGSTLTVGQQYDITWDYNSEWADTATILLIGGPATNNLNTIETITSSVANSAQTFTWTVDVQPTEAVYGFKIVWNTDNTIFQYSFPFSISGGTTSSSSTTTTTTGTAVTSLTKVNAQSTTTSSATWTSGDGCECDSTSWGHATGGAGWSASSVKANGAGPTSSLTWSQGGWSSNGTIAPTWTTTTTPAVTTAWVAATSTMQGSAGWGKSATTGTASSAIATGAASKAVSGGLAMFGGVAMAVLAL